MSKPLISFKAKLPLQKLVTDINPTDEQVKDLVAVNTEITFKCLNELCKAVATQVVGLLDLTLVVHVFIQGKHIKDEPHLVGQMKVLDNPLYKGNGELDIVTSEDKQNFKQNIILAKQDAIDPIGNGLFQALQEVNTDFPIFQLALQLKKVKEIIDIQNIAPALGYNFFIECAITYVGEAVNKK